MQVTVLGQGRGFHPWVRKIPWRRKWQPTPVFFPGKSHGQESLAGYSPLGHEESPLSTHTSAGMDCSLSPPPRWIGRSGAVSQVGRVSWYPGYLSIDHPAALTSGSLLGQQMEEPGLDKMAVSHLSGVFPMRPRCKGVSIRPCLDDYAEKYLEGIGSERSLFLLREESWALSRAHEHTHRRGLLAGLGRTSRIFSCPVSCHILWARYPIHPSIHH